MSKKDKDNIISLNDIVDRAEPKKEIQALRKERKILKSEIQALQNEYGNLETYFSDLKEEIEFLAIPPQPKIYKPLKKKVIVKSPCVAVAHFTDWHYGMVQDAEEIENFGEFSPDILEAYINNFVVDFIKWVELHRNTYVINEAVVLCTGDLISGDIHRDLEVTNAFPTPVQSCRCGRFLGSVLTSLSTHFEKLTVHFVVPDNHSRLTRKPQAKQQGLNSHNYTVGYIAKMCCSKQDNIDFNIYISHSKAVTVCNRQYLLTHGHDVMGWAGFPYYGIERKVAKEALSRLWESDLKKFHKCILGHWHAPLRHPWFWIGGSASGTDALDHKQGRKSHPVQCAWMIHPKKREFDEIEFDLHKK